MSEEIVSVDQSKTSAGREIIHNWILIGELL